MSINNIDSSQNPNRLFVLSFPGQKLFISNNMNMEENLIISSLYGTGMEENFEIVIIKTHMFAVPWAKVIYFK